MKVPNSFGLPFTGERYVPELRGTIALEHLHRYAYACQFVNNKVVLDIACGEGYGSEMLARTADQVCGVDIDSATIAHAKSKYKSEKLRFIQGRCEEIPLEDSCVDVVVSFETIEHTDHHDLMMSEIRRVLRPGGLLIISSPEEKSYGSSRPAKNPFHRKELDRREFEQLLNKFFKYTEILGQTELHGSAIISAQQTSCFATRFKFEKLPKDISPINGLPEAVYLIGLCSDHSLASPSASFCEQRILDSEAFVDLRNAASSERASLESLAKDRTEWAKRLEVELAGARRVQAEAVKDAEQKVKWAKSLEAELAGARRVQSEAVKDAEEKVKWAKSLEAELAKLRAAFAQEQKTVAERTEWAKRLEQELAAAAETNARERRKAEILGEEISALSQFLADEKQLVSERTAWAQSLEKDVQSARDAHNRAAQEAEDLLAELRAVLDSSCWKITAPLRWVILSARRLLERIRRAPQTVKLLCIDRQKGFFDASWYLQQYPDVRDAGKRPFVHYAFHGFFEGRMPRDFCPVWPVLDSPSLEPQAHQWRGFTQLVKARFTSPQRVFKAARTTLNLLRSGGLSSLKQGFDIALMLQPPLPDSFDPNLESFLRAGFGEDTTQRVMSLLQSIQLGQRDTASHEAVLRELRKRLKKVAKATAKLSHKTPAASIVVPVYNQVIYTAACAISLFESFPSNTFELIIADDCSTDETFKFFQGVAPSIKIVKTNGNFGFLRNCNNAAASVTGEFLVILNNDTIVLPGWLDELIGTFSSMPNCGIVGSKLINLDGTLQEAGGIFWNDGSAWNYGRGSDPAKPEFNYVRPTDYCSGASICLRTSVWRQHGGFDEYYDRAYCEDSDLSFRLRRDSDLETYYQPFSVVIHHEGVSSGKDITQGEKHYQYLNLRKFMQRWSPVLEKEHQLNGSNVFLARGRSSGKKTILVADNNIPQPDRDAGSRTVFQIINLLVNKGVNVVFWPHNQWYDPKYATWLQRLGVLVTYSSADSPSLESWLDAHGRHVSAVFLNRPHVALEMLPHVKKLTNARVFFYGHDIHHLRLAMEAQQRPTDRFVAEELEFYDQKEKTLWEGLDVIYYPSLSEVEYVRRHLSLSKHNTKVRLLPVYAFDTFNDAAQANVITRQGIIFVAGFAHRPNVNGALWFAKNVWPALRERHPNITFSCIGSNPPPELHSLRDVGIKVTGYVTDAELDAFYRNSRVSIAPLLTGGGMKGKVAEALRAGLPVVTTDIGAQGFEKCGDALDVCRNAEEMVAKISQLLTDDDLWMHRSKAGLHLAKERFSTDAMWNVLRDVV